MLDAALVTLMVTSARPRDGGKFDDTS